MKELEFNNVALALKKELEEFKQIEQLIHLLRDPNLSEKPWAEIRQSIIQS